MASRDSINNMNEPSIRTHWPIVVDCPPFHENNGGATVQLSVIGGDFQIRF